MVGTCGSFHLKSRSLPYRCSRVSTLVFKAPGGTTARTSTTGALRPSPGPRSALGARAPLSPAVLVPPSPAALGPPSPAPPALGPPCPAQTSQGPQVPPVRSLSAAAL